MEEERMKSEQKEKVMVIVEQKKKRKKKLFLLVLLLLITGVILTTSTYAWFTSNQTVAIGTITVNVEAQNGIQLSADGTNWRSIIQTAELSAVHATTYTASINQIPTTLEPVSTIGDTDTTGLMQMYYGTVGSNGGGDYILTAVKDTETDGVTGKFIAFDLFFRVDATSDIYITPNSGVSTTDVTDTGIKNAARMAFVVLGNTAAGSSITIIQGLNAGVTAPVFIWEPNYDVHTAAGVSHAFDTYGVTTTQAGGSLLAYSGVKAPIATADNVLLNQTSATAYTTTYSTLFDTVTPNYSTINGFTNNVQIFSLQAGITKVRIYMWIEGQDVDCENNASNGSISFDLQITTSNE